MKQETERSWLKFKVTFRTLVLNPSHVRALCDAKTKLMQFSWAFFRGISGLNLFFFLHVGYIVLIALFDGKDLTDFFDCWRPK